MGYRGRRHHLKRLNAPKSWLLDKMGGTFVIACKGAKTVYTVTSNTKKQVTVLAAMSAAGLYLPPLVIYPYRRCPGKELLKGFPVAKMAAPKCSPGPHKTRESLPMTLFLRNRLRYALTYSEVKKIVMQRLIKVDGKVRTDNTFPVGFMDVVSIEKTNENFRILYDVKGRFVVHRIKSEEAKFKLCRVQKVAIGPRKVPYIITHDGRTIRYPDPLVKHYDSVKLEIATGKLKDFIKFEQGNLCMVTGGNNLGRVGTFVRREKHPGSFDIIHLKDAAGHMFATRIGYVFLIGKGNKPMITLPRGNGVKLSVAEERDRRLASKGH